MTHGSWSTSLYSRITTWIYSSCTNDAIIMSAITNLRLALVYIFFSLSISVCQYEPIWFINSSGLFTLGEMHGCTVQCLVSNCISLQELSLFVARPPLTTKSSFPSPTALTQRVYSLVWYLIPQDHTGYWGIAWAWGLEGTGWGGKHHY